MSNPNTGVSRRKLLLSGSMLAASLVVAGVASAVTAPATDLASITQTEGVKMESVQFKNAGITMAGNVYLPKGFDPSKKYAAIVVVHPGGGVKEQTAGLYAQRLAAQGYV